MDQAACRAYAGIGQSVSGRIAMKILVVGDWHSELHEEAVYQAFSELNHNVLKFAWHSYFKPASWLERASSAFLKAQNKYLVGPRVWRLNAELVAYAVDQKPEIVFIYRGTHIFPSTLRKLRLAVPGVKLLGYNNDDPFSPNYTGWLWRHFIAGIQLYDLVFAYRARNIKDFNGAGARQVAMLRSWFLPRRNFPVVLTNEELEKYECDVVFIGHYEEDGRLDYLEEIVRQGWRLRIFGHGYGWDDVLARSSLLSSLGPVHTVWGDEYNKAICGAKVALCFFSRLNRDTYTRRCFEIPASGTLLMSEYSDDLASLFVEDKEAVFFKDITDMRGKLSWVLNDEAARASIALGGLNRVRQDGHDVTSRMRYVLDITEQLPEYQE